MQLEFSQQTFERNSNTKFHADPSSGIPVVACGRTDGQKDRQTDGRKDPKMLRVPFRNFANAPKEIKMKFILRQHCNNIIKNSNQRMYTILIKLQ